MTRPPTPAPHARPAAVASALSLLLAAAVPGASAAGDWPAFRGPGARGVADGHDLPVSWNVDTGENVRWRTAIPGMGHSSPVVSGERVFVTTAVRPGDVELVLGDDGGIDLASDRHEHSWRLYALDRTSGEVLWWREAFAGTPRADRHVKSSQANATPATDGRRVAAIFGPQGLAVYDVAGELLWKADLGVLDPGLFGDATSHWGHASSPVLHDGLLFVQVDRHADSFVAAFDAETGERRWRVERDEKPVWASPVVDASSGRAQLLVVGGDFDRALDPATGRELWRFPRDYQVKTPTPFVAGGLVILAGGYRGRPLYAVPADAAGTAEAAWVSEPGGPYTSTPVAYGGVVYLVRDTGVVAALDLATGEELFRERLGSPHSASPVASDGKVYFVGEDGTVRVLAARRELELLGESAMGESCMASPAIAAGTLFLRCRSHLWAIGSPAGAAGPPRASAPARP